MTKKLGLRPRGRPPIELDLKQVEKLAEIGCTDEEIGLVMGCSADTVARRRKNDPAFCGVLEKGRASRRESLRRVQTDAALDGNVTMMIWLGKQELGQSDKVEQKIAVGALVEPTTKEEAIEILRTLIGDAV